MKTLAVLVLMTCFLSSSVLAEFKLAPGVLTMEKIDAAVDRSKKTGRPLLFFNADTADTCTLNCTSSVELMKEFSQSTVMVYVHRHAGRTINGSLVKEKTLPAEVLKLVTDPKHPFAPYVIVVDPGYEKVIGTIEYKALKEDPVKANSDLKTALRKAKKSTA